MCAPPAVETAAPEAVKALELKPSVPNFVSVDEDGKAAQDEAAAAPKPGCVARAKAIYFGNTFVFNVIFVICLARAHASLTTKTYKDVLYYASIVAVVIIFLFTGLGLRTRELVKALAQFKFNAYVQAFNLGFLPVCVWAASRGLRLVGALSRPLANGVAVCGFLPMTVNMVIVLTKSSGGDEAAAVFNSACGNLLGVFVTPAWVEGLLRGSTNVSFVATLLKLLQRVLAPLFVGQMTQYHLPKVAAWAKKHKPRLKKLQEYSRRA